MKKTFMQKLMTAAILTVIAVSPSWADYTITKSNGDPVVQGTGQNDPGDYFIEGSDIVIESSGLVLSGTIDVGVIIIGSDCTVTLKDANITSGFGNGTMMLRGVNPIVILEGENSIVNTGTGPAIGDLFGIGTLTLSGTGELYMTSQFVYEGNGVHCIKLFNGTIVTDEGLTIKGSKEYNASKESLSDVVLGSMKFGREDYYTTPAFFVGDDFCNTLLLNGPEYPDLDPDAEYVIVTYKEGSDTKKAYYKTTDVETIEWLKGSDVE